jgi:hypothetical protein
MATQSSPQPGESESQTPATPHYLHPDRPIVCPRRGCLNYGLRDGCYLKLIDREFGECFLPNEPRFRFLTSLDNLVDS